MQTSLPGLFSCGNVLHVHDIVDNVTKEAERCGENAAKFVKGTLNTNSPLKVINGNGVRYVNPSYFYNSDGILNINFRVSKIFENAKIVVKSNNKIVREVSKNILLPAEMETVVISKKDLSNDLSVEIE